MYKFIFPALLVIGIVACSFKPDVKTINRLKVKAKEAKVYAQQNGLNTNMCVLVDMSIHSGKKRLFLWSFKGDSILKSAVCSHGTCDNLSNYDMDKSPQFSNTPDTHCSSLGKYKLGKRGWSSFGVNFNYKLHGLEKTNSNAYKRYIVFHSWSIIDDEETYPIHIAQSWGCPAVSNNFMVDIDKVIKKQDKSLLFWIYK